MEDTLEGKVALVTGGGTGIGRAVTEALCAAQAGVIVTGRRAEPLAELAQRFPGRVFAHMGDATQPGDAAAAVALCRDHFGRLDILVNNAGLFVRKPLAELSDAEIGAMLDVNVRATLAYCREAAPLLAPTRGCIINLSSAAASYARPGIAGYGASKAAVEHATRVLAVELGPLGIRVNAVAPGVTRTDMTTSLFAEPSTLMRLIENTALRRTGEPEEVARVVLFLASNDAAWVTGQVIAASGGLYL
jgi:NAD(P)-dependent dehydrogenase (short-subunit alcohol dehydrogenase family)